MQYTGPFTPLNLMMIPFDERACIFNDELVLADNLDESGSPISIYEDTKMSPFVTTSYPFKIQFIMSLICLGGSMRVRMNLTEYELRRNSILIVSPGAIGEIMGMSPDCRVAIIAFSDMYYAPEIDLQGAITIRKIISMNALLQFGDAEMEELMEVYRLMRSKIRQPNQHYKREMLMSYMQVLFCICCQRLASFAEQEASRPKTRQKQLFDRFMELLKDHYTSERAVGFYANELCVTPKYLSQVVYAVSGRHAGTWIRDFVILEAKALLKSQQYTVQQVADLLNFANQSFFGVYFKKAVGCSPSAYQNK